MDFNLLHRAAEPHHADAHAPIHQAHERLFKEAGEPEGSLRAALRLV